MSGQEPSTTAPGTSGAITNANGLDVLVEDADDPADGIKITVGPGSGKASFTACGIPSIKLSVAASM